jgi:uncharacterized membrane protein
MLAHQGGWDEILLVLGPIAIIAGLLFLAKKRVKSNQGTAPTPPADDTRDAG